MLALREMKAFPKAFPSEGKVAEAAQRGAKTDEVECRAANDVRFARDACLRQMMLGFAE